MNVHPISELEELMAEATAGGAERVLIKSQDFWDVDEQEKIDAVTRLFMAEYEAVCAQITEVWGPADFSGRWDDAGFPEWYDAVMLSYWRRGGLTAYSAFRHDDKELPMLVVVGVRR